jgi:predicted GTPase
MAKEITLKNIGTIKLHVKDFPQATEEVITVEDVVFLLTDYDDSALTIRLYKVKDGNMYQSDLVTNVVRVENLEGE